MCECNKRPVLAEDPLEADAQRILDILFRSTFTTRDEDLDDKNLIFPAKKEYKDFGFQEKHKFAVAHEVEIY